MTDRTQQTFSALDAFEAEMRSAVETAFDDWWLRGRGQMSGAYRNARVKEIAALLTRHFLALAEDAPDEAMHCYGVEIGGRKLIEPWPLPRPPSEGSIRIIVNTSPVHIVVMSASGQMLELAPGETQVFGAATTYPELSALSARSPIGREK